MGIGRGAGTQGEYGVFANVIEPDSAFRMGAKAQLMHGSRTTMSANWSAITRGGRKVLKHAPLARFANFRAAWLPPHQRGTSFSGSREEMEAEALRLNDLAIAERKAHPNRPWGKGDPAQEIDAKPEVST